MRWLVAACFIAVAILANVATAHLGLVSIGLGLSVTAGTFMAGSALILRDALHELLGPFRTYGVIVVAALGAALTAGPTLAVASSVAFAASELVDAAVYTALRPGSRAFAVLGSGAAGLAVDTVAFLALAGFPLTAKTLAGQFLVKGALTGLAAVWVAGRDRRAVPRHV
jgi:hypothetical protein